MIYIHELLSAVLSNLGPGYLRTRSHLPVQQSNRPPPALTSGPIQGTVSQFQPVELLTATLSAGMLKSTPCREVG